MIFKYFYSLIVFEVVLFIVNGYEFRGSLIFVIDDTGTMQGEIDQVKEKSTQIINAVTKSTASPFEDFVLVTFNDYSWIRCGFNVPPPCGPLPPNARVRVVTRNHDDFKRALDSIQVRGGADCPEMAMAGIELGLQTGKPNSLLLVFTDAAAKDHGKIEQIKSLSIHKSTQVTFLLTGKCPGREETDDYLVYQKLASATLGQVFNILKQDVSRILDYITMVIEQKTTTLENKVLKNGVEKFNFTVDSKISNVMISVSALNNTLLVIGPDNEEVETDDIYRTSNTTIVKMKPVPGVYTIKVRSEKDSSVVVTGATMVSFKYGFSLEKPSSLTDTSSKPIPDKSSYLLIELDSKDKDVELKTVELRDKDDKVYKDKKLPLKLINKDKQLYVTDTLIPPPFMFKLAVNGETKDKEKITRIAPTFIESHSSTTENMKPDVIILEGDIQNIKYKKPVTFNCKVRGFPSPDTVWKDVAGTVLPSKIRVIDQFSSVSTLSIGKVDKNLTLTCQAKNSEGKDEKSLRIITEKIPYFEILESPKDIKINFEDIGSVKYQIDSSPSSTITWYKNGEKIESNDDFDISNDSSTLKIKKMSPKLEGRYFVEAYNGDVRKIFDFSVIMIGAELPRIDKSETYYSDVNGSNIDIYCRILRGKPKPSIVWTFKENESPDFVQLASTEEILHLKNIGIKDAGIYRCKAYNKVGDATHEINLFVKHAPIIKDNNEQMKIDVGQDVKMSCTVFGVPLAEVRWIFNNTEIFSSRKYRVYRNHMLAFKGTISDTGIYTCEASNILGTARRIVTLDVYGPNKTPEIQSKVVNAGDYLELPCRTVNLILPQVHWTFHSMNQNIDPQPMKKDNKNNLKIERVQYEDEGYYSCVMKSKGKSEKITYEIIVIDPAKVKYEVQSTRFTAVEGDLTLRIPCQPLGRPPPTVTWAKEELFIAAGTPYYDIEKTGTLIIKNLTLSSAGTYKCEVKNNFGNDSQEYNVEIKTYPEPADSTTIYNTVSIEESTSSEVECPVFHEKTHLVRWFKGERFICKGELLLSNVTRADAGMYCCRVSTFQSSYSGYTKVSIGTRPRFTTREDTNIFYVQGKPAYLNCEATGDPPPKYLWLRNGDRLDSINTYYTFYMTARDIGQYKCCVENTYSVIIRTFKISVGECELNIVRDMNEKQPLLLDKTYRPIYATKENGSIRIPKKKKYILSCPDSSVTFQGLKFGPNVEATCVEKKLFRIEGREVDFTDIACEKQVRPIGKSTGRRCIIGNTNLITIGFSLSTNMFIGIYDVCIDNDKKLPIFTYITVDKNMADSIPGENEYAKSKLFPLSFEDIYDCQQQIPYISSMVGHSLNEKNGCCYTKRQFVNPRDLLPGISQIAPYHYLNVAPQWSSCGNQNWEEMERRVRSLTSYIEDKLYIWTGTSSGRNLSNTWHLKDRANVKQRVPIYFWKVVQYYSGSLAIIYINIPNLSPSEAPRYTICEDICDKVEWMRGPDWHDVNKGYIFCCSTLDFEEKFFFVNLFRGNYKVLKKL